MPREPLRVKAVGTWAAAVSLLGLAAAALAQRSQTPDVTAILAKCQQCHGATVQMSKLSVATRASVLQGGTHGPAIVPGNAADSLLYKRITGQEKPAMPMMPQAPLTTEEIAAIKDWIDQGAPWAEDQAGAQKAPLATAAINANDPSLLVYGGYRERKITDADRQWWSFKKPVRPAIPQVKDTRWNRSPIDALIRAKLDAKGLTPAPQADRRTLIRRAYLDLTGLLPSPAEVDAFVKDSSPRAYEELVDRLLASPHYGERWARLWLDVARYSDSTGYEYDYDVAEAWRYRDYVIKAFNEDKPYNQFILEQIAGDELDKPTGDSLTATGFVRLGPRVLDRDLENPNYRFDYLDDIVRTTYQSFQALTVNCARCHDHKFDPITRKDYYKSLATFNGFVEYDHPLVSPEEWAKYQKASNEINDKIKPLRQQINTIEAPYRKQQTQNMLAKLPVDIQEAVKSPEEKRTPGQKLLAAQVANLREDEDAAFSGDGRPALIKVNAADEQARKKLLDQVEALTAQLPPRPPVAFGVRDGDFRFVPHPPFQQGAIGGIAYEKYGFAGKYLPAAGDRYEPPPMYFASTGLGSFADEIQAPIVEPGILTVLAKANQPAADPPKNGYPTSGRRRALAEAFASEDNPLTARVMVNRIWYQHFGQGIVSTPNNFGKMGTPPSNPELLDWLAVEFMQRGWSVKQMQRLIMNSETYKMASDYYLPGAEKDSTIQLWRFPVKRLEAEIIRDAVLSTSGDLNFEAGGKPFFPSVPESVIDLVPTKNKWAVTKEDSSTWRRSIYAYVKRNLKYPMFEAFDQPDATLSSEKRDVTTVPTQALTLINNEFFLLQANHFAQRVAREAGTDPAAQVQLVYRIAFSREPSARELVQSLEFLKTQTMAQLTHVILNSNEFLYVN